jgi:hypothetical protein
MRTRIIMIRSPRALLISQTPFKDKEKNYKKSDSITGTKDSLKIMIRMIRSPIAQQVPRAPFKDKDKEMIRKRPAVKGLF